MDKVLARPAVISRKYYQTIQRRLVLGLPYLLPSATLFETALLEEVYVGQKRCNISKALETRDKMRVAWR